MSTLVYGGLACRLLEGGGPLDELLGSRRAIEPQQQELELERFAKQCADLIRRGLNHEQLQAALRDVSTVISISVQISNGEEGFLNRPSTPCSRRSPPAAPSLSQPSLKYPPKCSPASGRASTK